MPSLVDDSFPTTVLEGMFFSKPVIGTRVGGIPEMIIDKQTGFISDRGDSEDLKENIKKIIANPELIEKMGAEGKKRFETNFTEELFYKRLQSVFA